MKLTIHKQLGDTAIDTDIEGSVDDCLKVIGHLEDTKDNKYKIEVNGQLENVEHFSEDWLQKFKDERLVNMTGEDKQTIYLSGTVRGMLGVLNLDLDDEYPTHTLLDFQRALQKEVNKGRLEVN
ncbi:hypothetical protein EFM42_07400 [Levilactobacillus brevis]|uniref:hypothetical protein n=1 Tax=Levilactobacillus brevis TaxID=1580 RepID=UPI0021A445D9|nr:hypothetical protein [Levilactobacillus brevis]MCT2887236.1 hypothetical protein [Levilactobacillus brevis]